MQTLPSFLKDTKHTLEIIETINDRIDAGEVSLCTTTCVKTLVQRLVKNIQKAESPKWMETTAWFQQVLFWLLWICVYTTMYSHSTRKYTNR